MGEVESNFTDVQQNSVAAPSTGKIDELTNYVRSALGILLNTLNLRVSCIGRLNERQETLSSADDAR